MRTFVVVVLLSAMAGTVLSQQKTPAGDTEAIRAKLAAIKEEQERLNKVVHCREMGLRLKELSKRNAKQAEKAPDFLKARLRKVAETSEKLAAGYEVLAAKYEAKASREEIDKLWDQLKKTDAEYGLAERQLRFMRDLTRVHDQLKRYGAAIDADTIRQIDELTAGIAANERKLQELRQTYETQQRMLKADNEQRERKLNELVQQISKRIPAARQAFEAAQAKARKEADKKRKAELEAKRKAAEEERAKRRAEQEKKRAEAARKAQEARKRAEAARRKAEEARRAAEAAEREAREAEKEAPPPPPKE